MSCCLITLHIVIRAFNSTNPTTHSTHWSTSQLMHNTCDVERAAIVHHTSSTLTPTPPLACHVTWNLDEVLCSGQSTEQIRPISVVYTDVKVNERFRTSTSTKQSNLYKCTLKISYEDYTSTGNFVKPNMKLDGCIMY